MYLGIGLTHSFTNISFFQPSGEYLDVGTSMLSISGSLTLPDAVNFTAGSGTVNFNGSGAQIIPSSSSSAGYTFNNLTLSNTTSATNLLTFTEAATVDIGGGVDGFSFVDGPMAYVFTTTGL